MLKKCDKNDVKKFHKKMEKIIENIFLLCFPQSDFDAYMIDSLQVYLPTLFALFKADLIKPKTFANFLTKIQHAERKNPFIREQKYLKKIFDENYSKIVEKFDNETFCELHAYYIESNYAFEINNLANNCENEHLKKFCEQLTPQFIARKNTSTKVRNFESTKKVLKSSKYVTKFHIDEAMRYHIERKCVKHLYGEKNFNKVLKVTRHLILHGLMSRRGVARILQTIAKFAKNDERFEEVLFEFFEKTHKCFMGKQKLPEDVKEIFEVFSRTFWLAEQSFERAKIYRTIKKILFNHEKNCENSCDNDEEYIE